MQLLFSLAPICTTTRNSPSGLRLQVRYPIVRKSCETDIEIAIAASAVPLIYVMYYASPFVAYVHLKLPVFARRSREQLLKWAENIPPNTEVEITTIKSYGSLRITRMPISELQPVKAKFGIENLKRVPKTASSMTRPWWAPKERHMFFIDTTQRRKTVEAAVWQKAREQINNS